MNSRLSQDIKKAPHTLKVSCHNRLLDFHQDDFLSDVTLIQTGKTQAVYKVHKIVLASGSKYMFEAFKAYPKLTKINVPQPLNQSYETSSDDQIARILKYLYSNQNFDEIREEVTEKNIYNLYSQAYALRCDQLLKDLCHHIIDRLMVIENVAHFLQEAIEFEIPLLLDASVKMITLHFRDIIAAKTHDEIDRFLFSLPVRHFIDIIAADDLNIEREFELVDIVRRCIAYHSQNGEETPQKPEDVAGPDIWAKLSQAERDNRIKLFTAATKEIEMAKQKQDELDAAAYLKFGKK